MSSGKPRAFVWALVVVVSLLVGIASGFIYGIRCVYHGWFLVEQQLIAPILAADPAFRRLTIHEFSGGGAYISGDVPTSEDYDRLHSRLVQAIGSHRADRIMPSVSRPTQTGP